MNSDFHAQALNLVIESMQGSPVVSAAAGYLSANAPAVTAELQDMVMDRVPGFAESGNPEVLPDLAAHAPEHTREILRLLGGGAVGQFEFVLEHAHRRAEQRFPLEYTLHAYRCGHKVFSRWLREGALAAAPSPEEAQTAIATVADFAIEYTDAVSTLFAGAYLSRTQLLADVAGDQRSQLLNLLLDGYDESDSRVAGVLRRAGYLTGRLSFCVVLAQSVDPAEMFIPDRARRLADYIDRLFLNHRVRRLIDIRSNKVAVIFSDVRRRSGWTAPSSALASTVSDVLMKVGNAVLIGVSNDVPSTAGIALAYQQAQHAFELASRGNRVVQFSDLSARQLLQQLAGEKFQRVLPLWTRDFFCADKKLSGALYETLCTYADVNMNALKTADKLGIHANTVYARFKRIEELTGLQPRSYHALSDLLLLLECARRQSTQLTASATAVTAENPLR